jgi:hypothetical protein
VVEWLALVFHIKRPKIHTSDHRPANLTEVCAVFLSLSRQILGYCLKLNYECFLPHHFQFTDHPIIWNYIIIATDSINHT